MSSALKVAMFHLRHAIKHNSAVGYWQLVVKGLKEKGQNDGTRNTDDEPSTARGRPQQGNRSGRGGNASKARSGSRAPHGRKVKGR